MNNKQNGLLEVLLAGIAEEGEIDVEAWRHYYQQAENDADRMEVIWHTSAVTLATVGKHRADHTILDTRLNILNRKIIRNSVGMLVSVVASFGILLNHLGVDITTATLSAFTTGIVALFVGYITDIKNGV